MIRMVVAKDYQEMSRLAANIVVSHIRKKPDAVIGFATGGTPLGLYQELVNRYQEGEIQFGSITTFNLDEYVGLDRHHPQSYYRFMWDHLFSHIGLTPDQIHFPPGIFTDADAICREYEAAIAQAGGIDLQILGIGVNGHIGFNEPADTFTLPTHLVELAEETIEANARFFRDKAEVPRKAVTMGIKSIMSARSILLLASGESKAEAVREMFKGVADPQVPATILQLHQDVTLLVDREAAKLIEEKGETSWLVSR